jgi:multiple sugar transport system permease protein
MANVVKPKGKFATLFFIVLTAYFALPIAFLFISATKAPDEFGTTNPFWFGEYLNFFQNIQGIFDSNEGIYLVWLKNSLIYSFSGALGALICSAMAGFAIAIYDFKGIKQIQVLLLAMVMVPANTLVLPLFLYFANLNLVNTPWAVILPSLVNPLGTFLIAYYAKENLPRELISAARLDRASEIRIFLQLAIPILRPALATVFLLNLVLNWNNFFLPLVMLNERKFFPLTVGLGTAYGGPGLVTGSVIAMVPMLVAYLYLQRFWVKGLTAGSGVS